MYECSSFVYLDLEKTGSTFVRKVLSEIIDEVPKRTKKHQPLVFGTGKPRVMTIRDPYNYYYSLWPYGLDQKGSVYWHNCKYFPDQARQAYAAKTPDNFSVLLNIMFHEHPIAVKYGMDLYSFRIFRQIIPHTRRYLELKRLRKGTVSAEELLHNYSPEYLLRTESLNADFYRFLSTGVFSFMPLIDDWQSAFPIDRQALNQSKNRSTDNDHIRAFYSVDMLTLMREQCCVPSAVYEQASAKMALVPQLQES